MKVFLVIFILCYTLFLAGTPAVADTIRLEYSQIDQSSPYVRTHILRISRKLIEQKFGLTIAFGDKSFRTHSVVREIVQAFKRKRNTSVGAAINASFDAPGSDGWAIPRGPVVREGEILFSSTSNPTHPSFGLSQSGGLWLSHVAVSAEFVFADGTKADADINFPMGSQRMVLYTKQGLFPGIAETDLLFEISPKGLSPKPALRVGSSISASLKRHEAESTKAVWEAGNWLLLVQQASPLLHKLVGDLVVVPKANSRDHAQTCTPARKKLQPHDGKLIMGGGKILLLRNNSSAESVIPPGLHIRANQVPAPRSALCWNDHDLFFVTVDGVRPSFRRMISGLFQSKASQVSQGLGLVELAELMKNELTCYCGIELDGGKSSTLILGNELLNSPATGAEHPVNSALLLFELVGH